MKCACGKEYKYRAWLFKHQRKCNVYSKTPEGMLKSAMGIMATRTITTVLKSNPLLELLKGNSK